MSLKFNLWSILKQFIGKDLSRITMPIYLNLPQSMLQKLSEIMEYSKAIQMANKTTDKALQCGYILSAFIIIYANTIGTSKKPFNPLLGETYEVRDQKTQSRMVLE